MTIAFMAEKTKGRRAGRHHAFKDIENEALFAALKRYKELNNLTSEEVGERLGVVQQTANKYINGESRMGRPPAMKLVKIIGAYRSVEEFLEVECGIVDGVHVERAAVRQSKGRTSTKGTDNGTIAVGEHPERAFASNLVRRVGVTDEAIENVIARYHGEPRHIEMWWAQKFMSEQEFLNERALQRWSQEPPDPPKPKKR